MKVPRLPRLPSWIRTILEYRFPSSIDPYTGEQSPAPSLQPRPLLTPLGSPQT